MLLELKSRCSVAKKEAKKKQKHFKNYENQKNADHNITGFVTFHA